MMVAIPVGMVRRDVEMRWHAFWDRIWDRWALYLGATPLPTTEPDAKLHRMQSLVDRWWP